MKIVHTPAELRALPGPIAFVPTMGALHEGHLELVRQGKNHGQTVVVSIFVNPTQFAPHEDFTKYPRNLERDAELAASAGADVVYAPAVETMYPRRVMATISVPEVTEHFEGAFRPGHFDGVATVVMKLFQQVQPDVALFGRKDLQQCAVIQRMVADLDVPLRLEFVPTVREADGLAMSSRNVYLSPEERAVAPVIYATLKQTREGLLAGADVANSLASARACLTVAGFAVDYFDLVEFERFVPTTALDGAALVVAARLGKTRLIDNLVV